MRYSKTLWDTNTIYNPTNMNHIEQGIYDADLREGGIINGLVQISYAQDSYLFLGDNSGNKGGMLRIYDKNDSYCANLYALDSSRNRNIGIPPQNGIVGLQDKVTILAESTGSKTHAQHIAVLKAVWDTLSTDQRMKCLIKRANQIYMPTSIADATGRFSAVEIDNQKVYIEMLRMSNTSFTILNGTNYQDISSSTSNASYTLYLPL